MESGKKPGAVKEDDGFVARRSLHVTGPTNADGDTWQETLAVCEMADRLMIRSYFSNKRTRERQWDEPPSGASHVIHASESMRHMANAQLQEMEIAMGAVPDTDKKERSTPKKGGGFGGFFRRTKVEETSVEKLAPEKRIQYKPDSFLARTKKEVKKQQIYDEMLDPAMQRALVSSMACTSRTMDYCDVELERALALSLGETQGHAADRTPQRSALKEGSDSKDDLRYRRSSSREGSAHQARSSSTEPSAKHTNTTRDASAHQRTSSRKDSAHQRSVSREASTHRRRTSTEASTRRRSASSDYVGEGRSQRDHKYRSEDRKSHLHNARSVHQRINPRDRLGHRFPSREQNGTSEDSTQLLCDGLVSERQYGPGQPAENRRPDPPSDLDAYGSYDLDDGSIVHFEFSHDEEEALVTAMSLSLLDVNSPTLGAVASKPQVSEMTEDDQLSLALTESLAMAPPEVKINQKGAFPTTSTDDEDDRKLPAVNLNGSLLRPRPPGGGEGKNSSRGDFKSSTYVVSRRDESRSPARRKPPSRESSFRQLHRQTRDNDPGLKTTQLPTRTTYSTGRSRSMSPALRASTPMDGPPITDLLPGKTSGVIRHSRRSQSPHQGELDTQRDKLTHEKTQSKFVSTESIGSLGGSNHRRRDRNITHEEARIRQEEQMLKEALRVSLNEHTLSLNQF